jgi:hypothetical protein
MSHDAAANRSVHESSRRRVRFQTTMEDLEGRVLLSGAHHHPVPHVPVRVVHVRVVHPPKVRMRLTHRALLGYGRTQSPTINIPVNVQTTIAGSTATSASTPATSSTQTPAVAASGTSSGAIATPSPSTTALSPVTSTGQAWPALVSPSTTTATAITSSSGTAAQSTQTSASTSTSATSTTASTTSTASAPTTPQPAPPTFPDGTLLINAQTGEIDQYSGGDRHLISPPVAAKMGITSAQLTSVTADKFNLIPAGQDYFPDGMFLRNTQTGEISEYSGGSFHFVSIPVANTMKLTGNNVVTITADQYNKVSKTTDFFPEGILIQNVQTGEVDLYSSGQRHWISVPVFTRMNITTAQITIISASQFNAVPQGQDYFQEGTYLENQVTGEISQYSGGYNHLISSPVAAVMGLTSAQLVSVTPGQYNAIPRGLDYYPNGIFVENNQTGEVDQMSGGQRHWVSAQDMLTIGLTGDQIAIIGADQFNAIPLGPNYVATPLAVNTPQGQSG